MQAFVANLTAAVLFIHAAFGCGWHHAHGENHAVLATDACCDHQHHDHCSHEPCDHDADPHLPSPTAPGPCCEHCAGSCVYTQPQKVELNGSLAVVWIDLLATAPILADAQTLSATWHHIGDSPHQAAPELGLHLLYQSLLI